jgi:hypothetical protein
MKLICQYCKTPIFIYGQNAMDEVAVYSAFQCPNNNEKDGTHNFNIWRP